MTKQYRAVIEPYHPVMASGQVDARWATPQLHTAAELQAALGAKAVVYLSTEDDREV